MKKSIKDMDQDEQDAYLYAVGLNRYHVRVNRSEAQLKEMIAANILNVHPAEFVTWCKVKGEWLKSEGYKYCGDFALGLHAVLI